jgi:hypothetical protein
MASRNRSTRSTAANSPTSPAGCGIREETFEYWGGIGAAAVCVRRAAEQELTRGPLVLPSYHPAADVCIGILVGRGRGGLSTVKGDAMKVLGKNPSLALHHPGFHYRVAARCTEVRKERFLAAVEAEVGDVSQERTDYQSCKNDCCGIVEAPEEQGLVQLPHDQGDLGQTLSRPSTTHKNMTSKTLKKDHGTSLQPSVDHAPP